MMFRRHEAFLFSLLWGVYSAITTLCASIWEKHVPTAVVIIIIIIITIIIGFR